MASCGFWNPGYSTFITLAHRLLGDQIGQNVANKLLPSIVTLFRMRHTFARHPKLAIDISVWNFQTQSSQENPSPLIRTLYYQLTRRLRQRSGIRDQVCENCNRYIYLELPDAIRSREPGPVLRTLYYRLVRRLR